MDSNKNKPSTGFKINVSTRRGARFSFASLNGRRESDKVSSQLPVIIVSTCACVCLLLENSVCETQPSTCKQRRST